MECDYQKHISNKFISCAKSVPDTNRSNIQYQNGRKATNVIKETTIKR